MTAHAHATTPHATKTNHPLLREPMTALADVTLRDAFRGVPIGRLARVVAEATREEAASALAPAPEAEPYVAFMAEMDKAFAAETCAERMVADGRASRGCLRRFERAVVVAALTFTKGNVSAAARRIGIERKALERKIVKFTIDVKRLAG